MKQERKPTETAELNARERLIRTASSLFDKGGVHRTGTDLIIEKADVAKMTFYRLFKSKAGLVAECFRRRDAEWFALLKAHIDRHVEPEERALALFDAFAEWFQQTDYGGCPFVRGLYDFSRETDDREIIEVIDSHFAALQALVTELLKAVRPKDYAAIQPQFMSLLAGSITVSQLTRSAEVARVNRELAQALLSAPPRAASGARRARARG
jgi:AcrR family transcriptional regulator